MIKQKETHIINTKTSKTIVGSPSILWKIISPVIKIEANIQLEIV